MITKREAERKEQAEREKLRSKWEEDRRKEAANKSSANSVRRRSSASERKVPIGSFGVKAGKLLYF